MNVSDSLYLNIECSMQVELSYAFLQEYSPLLANVGTTDTF